MRERIKQLRKLKGLNQTEFGAKIGLSQKAVANIETGATSITQRNFDAICREFSVNPDWLRDGVGEMFVETREELIQSVAGEYELTPDETSLLRTFLDLEPQYRRGVLEWAKNFATALAAQQGIEIPAERRKPDSELTKNEMLELIGVEYDEVKAAQKRGASTSSVSIGTSGTSKKISINS